MRKAGGCSHLTPGSPDQEEEEPLLPREKGGRGVNTLPSCRQLASNDQDQDVGFPSWSACPGLSRRLLPERRKEVVGRLRLLFQTASHARPIASLPPLESQEKVPRSLRFIR